MSGFVQASKPGTNHSSIWRKKVVQEDSGSGGERQLLATQPGFQLEGKFCFPTESSAPAEGKADLLVFLSTADKVQL